MRDIVTIIPCANHPSEASAFCCHECGDFLCGMCVYFKTVCVVRYTDAPYGTIGTTVSSSTDEQWVLCADCYPKVKPEWHIYDPPIISPMISNGTNPFINPPVVNAKNISRPLPPLSPPLLNMLNLIAKLPANGLVHSWEVWSGTQTITLTNPIQEKKPKPKRRGKSHHDSLEDDVRKFLEAEDA